MQFVVKRPPWMLGLILSGLRSPARPLYYELSTLKKASLAAEMR